MHSTQSCNTNDESRPPVPPAHVNIVTEVDVEEEPLESEYSFPVIPPDRRLSWVGWTVAIGVFLVNKKVGLIFIVLLLVFGKFPTLNLKSLPGKAGKFFKKMRS